MWELGRGSLLILDSAIGAAIFYRFNSISSAECYALIDLWPFWSILGLKAKEEGTSSI